MYHFRFFTFIIWLRWAEFAPVFRPWSSPYGAEGVVGCLSWSFSACNWLGKGDQELCMSKQQSSGLFGPHAHSCIFCYAILQAVLALLNVLNALVIIDEDPVFLRYEGLRQWL